MTKSISKENWIKKARAVHGDKYDYSKVEYKGWRERVTITCPKHGEFEQAADAHLSGRDCKKCADAGRGDTRESFIEKAASSHGTRYDYSKVAYVNARTKVTITCRIHGDFDQKPSNHLLGKGCIKCSRLRNPELIVAAKLGDKSLFDKIVIGKPEAPVPDKQPSKTPVRKPLKPSKPKALYSVKTFGMFKNRNNGITDKIYKGLDLNKNSHYFRINGDSRVHLTISEINKNWFKCY